MSFVWPYALALLVVPALFLAFYLWQRRRRRRFAVTYGSLQLIREALPTQSRWRRWVPLALFLLALTSLGIAAARPQTTVGLPMNRTTIILALDISGSMCSTDVAPNRLAAAQDVARDFVQDQPGGTRIGLVVFSGLAQVLVPATTDRKAVTTAIDGLTTGRGTAIGTALLRAIDAISVVNPNVERTGVQVGGTTAPAPRSGDYQPDIVVLLTDGAATQGVDPIVAAEQAADRGVRVYTIGFGTDVPAPLVCTRDQLGSDSFGGQGFQRFGPGGENAVPTSILQLNDDSLQEIADLTGGSYHRATDAKELTSVFRGLPSEVAITTQHVEVSFAFGALGALFATMAIGLSLYWNRYRA